MTSKSFNKSISLGLGNLIKIFAKKLNKKNNCDKISKEDVYLEIFLHSYDEACVRFRKKDEEDIFIVAEFFDKTLELFKRKFFL